jgi:hypothetical protein
MCAPATPDHDGMLCAVVLVSDGAGVGSMRTFAMPHRGKRRLLQYIAMAGR